MKNFAQRNGQLVRTFSQNSGTHHLELTADVICRDDDRCNSPPESFIQPGFVQTEGVSILTRSMLDDFIDKCSHNVVIESVLTDLDSPEVRNSVGPWSYKDSTKVTVTYLVGDDGERRQISLADLKRRGFGNPSRCGRLRYGFYSWIRFKNLAKQSGHTVPTV